MGELVYKYDNPTSQDLSQIPLRLTCICDARSFSYAVENIGDGTVEGLRTFVFERNFHFFSDPLGFLDEVMRKDRILYESFEKQVLFVRGIAFKLLKGRHSSDEIRASLPDGFANTGPDDQILIDDLTHHPMSLVYAVPKAFLNEVELYFSKAEIMHAMTGLICTQQQRNDMGFVFTARVSAQWLEVAVVEGKKLLYANQFHWTDPADILYYMAAVIEQLGISVNKYVLCGSHSDQSFKMRMAREFDVRDEVIELWEVPGKRLMDLSGLAACV